MDSTQSQIEQYYLKRKILALADSFRIFDLSGNLNYFSKSKLFKLKEDIRIYTDEAQTQAAFTIKARQIIDFSAAYDIMDANGKKIGALKRKGWSSMVRDAWIFMDENDQEIGHLAEDSMTMALIRRFVANIIPQNFSGFLGEEEVFEMRQRFNPFVYTLDIKIKSPKINKIMVVAMAVLIAAIDGRQQ